MKKKKIIFIVFSVISWCLALASFYIWWSLEYIAVDTIQACEEKHTQSGVECLPAVFGYFAQSISSWILVAGLIFAIISVLLIIKLFSKSSALNR